MLLRSLFNRKPTEAPAPEAALPPLAARVPRAARRPASDKKATQAVLSIPCPDPTAEERLRDEHLTRGQHLVRQERWEDLSDIIKVADHARSLTPGAMPVAELMAFGARADVVQAAEHALLEGGPNLDLPLLGGIEDLEHVLAEFPDDSVIGSIVAQSHMDIGWAWRGNGWDAEVPARNRAAFAAHFDRAGDIMQVFDREPIRSPLVAATCCALLSGPAAGQRGGADRYERLIDLNPHNPRPMRAMGNHLLPRWFGSYAELELEARRTAARTQSVWGAGGYTWVQFDAISCDDQACANLDLDFFLEGLRDILVRKPNPYTANLLAAYCANTMGQTSSGHDEADQMRARIATAAGWIVREHLTELHPMIWAHAARGFDNNLRVRSSSRFAASGREDAMRIIAGLFSREIASGKRIVFTDTGPVAQVG